MPILTTLTHRSPEKKMVKHPQLGAVPLPDEIRNWFIKMIRLEGVPISYLIPHSQLLPKESIRFFYVDDNWLKAMVAGAFSIGHHTCDVEGYQSLETEASKAMTGLLLHSDLVKDFSGMKILVYTSEDDTQLAELIRQEKLTPNILLMLFLGEIDHIELFSPPEGLDLRIEGDHQVDENGVLNNKAFEFESSKEFVQQHSSTGDYILIKK